MEYIPNKNLFIMHFLVENMVYNKDVCGLITLQFAKLCYYNNFICAICDSFLHLNDLWFYSLRKVYFCGQCSDRSISGHGKGILSPNIIIVDGMYRSICSSCSKHNYSNKYRHNDKNFCNLLESVKQKGIHTSDNNKTTMSSLSILDIMS
jgi:hypothetical protein